MTRIRINSGRLCQRGRVVGELSIVDVVQGQGPIALRVVEVLPCSFEESQNYSIPIVTIVNPSTSTILTNNAAI